MADVSQISFIVDKYPCSTVFLHPSDNIYVFKAVTFESFVKSVNGIKIIFSEAYFPTLVPVDDEFLSKGRYNDLSFPISKYGVHPLGVTGAGIVIGVQKAINITVSQFYGYVLSI